MKLLLSGNFTLDPLKGGLESHDIAVGDFNDFRALLAGQRELAVVDRDAVILLIDGVEFAAEFCFDQNAITEAAREYAEACVRFAQAHPSLIIIASTIRLSSFGPQSFGDLVSGASATSIEYLVAQTLAEGSRRHANLYVLDLARLIGQHGERVAYNPGMRFFARFGFSPSFAKTLTHEIELLFDGIFNRSKKVLALDFDNTLWGGIVGEAGPGGIELSQDGKGRAYRQFQALIREVSRRGIVLVGVTKNNETDVIEVFEKNEMMVLKRSDFSLLYANWDEKPRNIEQAAQALNLGLDSFVFLDDNPVERKMMTDMQPEVHVPEFPIAPEQIPDWFRNIIVPEFFPAYRVTAEDRAKTQQYRANAARSTLRNHMSIAEFIASLNIELQFSVNEKDNAARLSQMTQKTNQFNLTTRRYSIPEITQMIEGGQYDVVGMEYSDRFGKEGIVGLAIFDGDKGEVDSFLLSCRVINRGVEGRLMREIECCATSRGYKELVAVFRPTKKNAVSCDFLQSQGFHLLAESNEKELRYRKSIDVERKSQNARSA